MNAVLAITLKMHLTLSFGFMHKILQLNILVVIYNKKCMHFGNQLEIVQQVYGSAMWCMSYSNPKHKNTSAH